MGLAAHPADMNNQAALLGTLSLTRDRVVVRVTGTLQAQSRTRLPASSRFDAAPGVGEIARRSDAKTFRYNDQLRE